MPTPGPEPAPETETDDTAESPAPRRRLWLYAAALAALTIAAAGVWQTGSQEHRREDRKEQAAAYKGSSGAALTIDRVSTDVVARWNSDKSSVTIELRASFDRNARYLQMDAAGESARSVGEDGWFPKAPEIVVPVKDPVAEVTVRVAVGGKDWKEGAQAPARTVRLSPTGIAVDAETGQRLPFDL
ncbi:hypothetical protein AB0953_29825 [Streptomyces sp. NPDC046866]|uniref:hypothetical protein n=1 Tax=Streptomyces sp. NPDC046866 TaxID=3154921 RepID=UPI0034539473